MGAAPIVLTKLAAGWPPQRWRDVTVVAAVSGGADSVALARGLHELRAAGAGRLVIAHFNHRLRGAESDADQAFVEALAVALGAPIVVGGRVGEGVVGTSEESLREARYSFLARAASEVGARYVVTAHTADDQVETVLHNVIRGTGLAGLAGIPRVRRVSEAATLMRPLLGVTRAEVLEYLRLLGQTFREDVTNQSLDYTRNRIRHELLPLVARDYNPQVRAALLRLSQIAGEADSLLDEQAESLLQVAARAAAGAVEIDLAALEGAHPALIRHALLLLWRRQGWPLQDMSFEKWEQLLLLARVPAKEHEAAPRQVLPGNIHAERAGGVLRLTRPAIEFGAAPRGRGV